MSELDNHFLSSTIASRAPRPTPRGKDDARKPANSAEQKSTKHGRSKGLAGKPAPRSVEKEGDDDGGSSDDDDGSGDDDGPRRPRTRVLIADEAHARITLLRKTEVAKLLGVSTFTLTHWLDIGQFPKPIFLQSGSPARWRLSDINAFMEKRRISRRPRPPLRGALKQKEVRAKAS